MTEIVALRRPHGETDGHHGGRPAARAHRRHLWVGANADQRGAALRRKSTPGGARELGVDVRDRNSRAMWPTRLWDFDQAHRYIGDAGGYGVGYTARRPRSARRWRIASQ